MNKVIFTSLVLVVFLNICLSIAERKKWRFILKLDDKKTHDVTLLKATIGESKGVCGIRCTYTQFCQSFSYNDGTQHCLLQSVLSDYNELLTVDAPGFTLHDMETPLEANETKPVDFCPVFNPCENNGTCVNLPGFQYSCNCVYGFVGANCSIQINGICLLDSPCQNSGTCVDNPGPDYACNCTIGFSGRNCSEDVDFCTVFNPCENNGTCVNLPGFQYSCNCLHSFVGVNCSIQTNSICLLESPCLNNGICVENPGPDYTCNCYAGYSGRNCSTVATSKVLLFAGEQDAGGGGSLEIYNTDNPASSTTLPLALSNKRKNFATARFDDGKVLIVGGNFGTSEQIYIYDPQLQIVTSAGLPTTPLSGAAAVTLNDVPIVCGGQMNSAVVKTCRKLIYNITTQQWDWENMAPMNESRQKFHMVVHNQKIYAVGGVNESHLNLRDMERYDSATDSWQSRAPMKEERSTFGLALLNDQIYACGFVGLTCERYDPVADTWNYIANMTYERRYGTAMVAVHGKLYLFGGIFLPSALNVEKYDPGTNTWTTVADTLQAKKYFQAVQLYE